MHSRRYCLFIVLSILALSISADMLSIDIDDMKPVLDNSSGSDLPYYFYLLPSGITVDSVSFEEPVSSDNKTVLTFSGNSPLSYPASKHSPSPFKSELSPGALFHDNSRLLKLFPYNYKDALTEYRRADVFYSNNAVTNSPKSSSPDYIIVCRAQYDTAFSRFADWKTKAGYRTAVYTVEHIDTVQAGIDLQERIRNFLKDKYLTSNFKYLLLAGDSTMIPARRMFAMECGAGYYDDEDSIPSDLYYSAYDGDFNYDGDHIYGEIEDSADLYGDVYAGRMLFDTSFGPTYAINRTISYERTEETEHLSRGMFLGMVLWDPPYTPGGELKDMIGDDIIPSGYNIKKFYESQGHSGDSDILDSLDMGYSIVNHAGHGSYKGVWVDGATAISTWDALGLTNGNKTGLFYSIGCWVGAFDRANDLRNFSMCLQTADNGGFVSVVTNSRYGWGAPGYPGWGVSDTWDYAFFKLLFEEDNKQAGHILNELKKQFAPYSDNENLYRWHMYQVNLFGDPSLRIYTQSPDSILTDRIFTGDSLIIYASDAAGMPLVNVCAAVSTDSLISRDTSDVSGRIVLRTDTLNMNYLTLIKDNYITHFDSFTVDSGSPSVALVYDRLFSGIANTMHVRNYTDSARSVHLTSSAWDTVLTIPSGSANELQYSITGRDVFTDSVLLQYDSGDILYRLIIHPLDIEPDSFSFDNNVFYYNTVSRHFPLLTGGSLKLSLDNGLYLDTALAITGDSVEIEYCTSLPPESEYTMLSRMLLKESDTLFSDSVFIINRNSLFSDDFQSGFDKWQTIGTGWIITDSSLHCGSDSSYYPSMHSSITSDSFLIMPSSVCSIEMNFEFPALEFDSGSPVFDVDGMFISIITGTDTTVLDFLSSGGALESKSALYFDGIKGYPIGRDTPYYGRLHFTFISDSVDERRGIYIDNIRMHSPYSFYSPDSGLLDEDVFYISRRSGLISSGNFVYYINRLDRPLEMNIYAVDGRCIYSRRVTGSGEHMIDLSNEGSGVYFLRINYNNRIYSDRITVIR
ncbi:MAG: C25 family cysteine peptidase [bacterium]